MRCVPCQNLYISISPPKSKKERNDVLGVGWGAERPGTSIVVAADGPEPLRSDIRLPLTPIRYEKFVKTGIYFGSTRLIGVYSIVSP